MKIEEFKVRCPMDNTLHNALARVSVTKEAMIVGRTECHKSWECETCNMCLISMREKYEKGMVNQGIMEKPL